MGVAASLLSKKDIRAELKFPEFKIKGYIGRSGIVFLGKELEKQENQHVKVMHLFCEADGAEALGELVAKNTILETLFVRSWGSRPLTDEPFAFLCKGLMANETLTSFGTSFVPWTKPHVASLVEVIRCSKRLRELHIEQSEELQDGALDVLEAVIDAGRIEKLRFSLCSISVDCLRQMCDALRRNNTLHCLHLDHESFGVEGFRILGEFLSKDATLEEFSLVACHLEPEGLAVITNGLKQNKTIRRLDFRSNDLGPKGARMLASLLQEDPVLEELVVRNCSLGTEGVDTLVDALLRNTTVTTLVFDNNGLQSGESIGRLLTNNSTLRVLGVGDIDLSSDGSLALVEGLMENTSLKSLYITPRQSQNEFVDWCAAVLIDSNGSLIDCKKLFLDVCARNRAMHDRVRQSVQAVRVLHKRKDSPLSILPKEVMKLIGVALWDTRTEIAAWAPK